MPKTKEPVEKPRVTPDIVPKGYKRSLDDLVKATNQRLIDEFKVSACLDKFLIKITDVLGAENMEQQFPSFKDVPEEHQEAVNRIKAELDADLGRLVPEQYGPGKEIIDLDDFEGVEKQWQNWRRALSKGNQSNDFSRALLESAADIYHRKVDPQATNSPNSEQKTAFVDACRQLKDAIEDQRGSASFACGGSIAITDEAIAEDARSTLSPPVRLYWHQEDDTRRLMLPGSKDNGETTVEDLLRTSSPATFGRGGEDVLDPTYRQACKLEPTKFATTFHPADFDILEAIQQALLPNINIGPEDKNRMASRGILAELYKLNIYSGPSGLFRSHVDTPRSRSQIGSLVVSLPSHFEGGDLIVRHQGRTVTFDWDKASASHIQWAAFYSDCEHEIKTITAGHRITLTYNLYVQTQNPGEIISNVLDPKRLPLYTHMKSLMENEDFLPDGGILGMFCSHAYAHTAASAQHDLPRALKGSDLAFYSAFKSLGVSVDIRPIIETDGGYKAVNPDLGIPEKARFTFSNDDDFYEYRGGRGQNTKAFWEYFHNGTEIDSLAFCSTFPDYYESWEDVDTRWKALLLNYRVHDLDTIGYHVSKRFDIPRDYFHSNRTRVGYSLHKFSKFGGEYQGTDARVADRNWPNMRLPGITWLTGPTHTEPAFTYGAYGNEPSVETCYSAAAILAVIPSFAQRTGDQMEEV